MPEEREWEFRDRLNVIDDFTNLLRSSFFVSLYSFLESRLVNECHSRKGAHTPLRLSDIRARNELDRIQKYFTKVLRVYFPNETTQWQEVQNYRVLRNCIVHNRGVLSGSREERQLQNYIDRKSDLRIVGDEVFLDTAFCSEALETVKAFFCRLISSNKS